MGCSILIAGNTGIVLLAHTKRPCDGVCCAASC